MFNENAGLMMALCEGLTRIDVFDLNDGCRLSSSMQTSDTFAEMAFSTDAVYAVGFIAAGTYLSGDLFASEIDLVARTKAFAAGE